MRGVLVLGDHQVQIADFPPLEIGPDECLVRMQAAAICGSDLHGYHASRESRGERSRQIAGHEPCGVVEQVGELVTEPRVGDRVMIYPGRGCGRCKRCLRGDVWLCPQNLPLKSGSMADYTVAPARYCLPLPDDFSFVLGAIIACNAGTAYYIVKRMGLSGGATLAVFGLGPVGLCGLLWARAFGAQVIGVDPIPERRKLAEELGAVSTVDPTGGGTPAAIRGLTDGEGVQFSLETSGHPMARSDALDCLASLGTAGYVGISPADQPSIQIGRQVMRRNLGLVGSHIYNLADYYDMVALIRRHKIDFERIATHRFPLERAPEAFQVGATQRTGKVLFVW